MAILMRQTMPDGITAEMLDEVSEDMGVHSNPPEGMIVHVHFMEDGRAQVVDVWESAEHLEQFRQNRLMPSIMKVTSAHGVQMAQPETTLTEVTMIRG